MFDVCIVVAGMDETVQWGRGVYGHYGVWLNGVVECVGDVYGCRYMLADRSVSGRLNIQNEHTNVCPSDPSIRRSVDRLVDCYAIRGSIHQKLIGCEMNKFNLVKSVAHAGWQRV